MERLIADSGIQFITREIEFNLSQPLQLGSGKILKYSFVEAEDILLNSRVFTILCKNNDTTELIPIDELLNPHVDVIERSPNGRERIDEMGMVAIKNGVSTDTFSIYDEDNEEVFSIGTLQYLRVPSPVDEHERVLAFDLLLDKWLPIPMFRLESDGFSSDNPLAWCRMKMTRIGQGLNPHCERYRLIYAFDTQMGSDVWDTFRPFVSDEDNGVCKYAMCNRVDLLLPFLSSDESFHAFSDYIASLLGIDITKDHSYKYKAFYIYFLNFIRLSGGSPEVELHNKNSQIDVDLVLDIGNSRTCGILFEESDFRKGKMLELHNLTQPDIYYENKTFDMRIVFRKADFGNDIVLGEDMFQWNSFVRIGEEAQRLIYDSIGGDGLALKTTNYSSPKRYLWDKKKYVGQWENLTLKDDPCNVSLSGTIAIPTLSSLFTDDGSYKLPDNNLELDGFGFISPTNGARHYSRSSLMTFAFIEIFQHALMQVNSVRYREQWGNVDIRRVIRNVIITCPTAMSLQEQVFLRKSAHDAFEALTQCHPKLPLATISPDPQKLQVTDPYADKDKRVWKYDEASCCQLVYLYAEIAQRYGGQIKKFIEMKGHTCTGDDGAIGKELTIGTIDIGAGTTDIMICSYKYDEHTAQTLVPRPLFYDSFYLAGDDILRNIIQNIVIEGADVGVANIGNISSALTARICAMSDHDLRALPCNENIVYKNKVGDICQTIDKVEKNRKKIAFASNLIHDFFGADSSMQSFRDRQYRNDFNTQISMPIAQKMLELLRTHRPSKLYSYEDIFPDMKPADYLLEHFAHHFGFRFEELSWRYNPEDIADIVKSTMEPLLKQLALVLYSQRCDVIVLAGRPTSLDPITELFIKYLPVSPNKLIRLNDYRVGSWFPTADGQGYFYDQKAIVAVGAMIGYLASQSRLSGMSIDFECMIKEMKSTANYMGIFDAQYRQVKETLLSPTTTTAQLSASSFPVFIGCRQLDSPMYQARPMYAIYNHGTARNLSISIVRNFTEDREELKIEEITDEHYNSVRKADVEVVQQSLVEDGNYWLDKGEFELSIK